MALINRIAISRDHVIEWNRVATSRDQLREYLRIVSTMYPLPFTVLDPDPDVDCPFLESIRDDMAQTLPCSRGGCGEGRGPWEFLGFRPPDTEEGRAALRELEQAADDIANNVAVER